MLKRLLLLAMCIIFIAGCVKQHSVPWCIDINKTGIECVDDTPTNYGKEVRTDFENAICKMPRFYGDSEIIGYCFNTLENATEQLDNLTWGR